MTNCRLLSRGTGTKPRKQFGQFRPGQAVLIRLSAYFSLLLMALDSKPVASLFLVNMFSTSGSKRVVGIVKIFFATLPLLFCRHWNGF